MAQSTLPAEDFDVAIIGAGPVGLALAIELARQELAVLVIDRRPPPELDPRLRPQLLVAREGDLANLDHLGVDMMYRARIPTLNQALRPWWGKLRAGLSWLILRRGPLGMSLNQAGGFARTREGLDRPDMQLYLQPVSYMRAPPGTRVPSRSTARTGWASRRCGTTGTGTRRPRARAPSARSS